VRAQLRREEATATLPPVPKMEKYEFSEVEIDFKRREVRKSGKLQDLTNREFHLLEYFVHHPGELLTRDRLLGEIWGYQTYTTTRTVDSHILRLRKHIEPDPENPRYIKTIRGAGYLFEMES
jgi:DNA-binding response OmpR family regulator